MESLFEAPSVFLVLPPSGTGPGHPHPRPWAGCHVILAAGLTALRILVRSHREGYRPICVGSNPHFSRRCWSGQCPRQGPSWFLWRLSQIEAMWPRSNPV